MSFPLYENLIKKSPSCDLTTKEKEDFVKRCKNLDDEGHEIIYALIRCYHIKNNPNTSFVNLPYDGKTRKNSDMVFSLEKLPLTLKQILYRFLEIHEQKMKEEELIREK